MSLITKKPFDAVLFMLFRLSMLLLISNTILPEGGVTEAGAIDKDVFLLSKESALIPTTPPP